MLIIASDIHLADGSCAKSISPSAFYLFADRLREMAYQASWRTDNTYQPIDGIDLVLLGDILDPLQSTRWLDTQPGEADYIRPWVDPLKAGYNSKLSEVTTAIINANKEGLKVLKISTWPGALTIPPATRKGKPIRNQRQRFQCRCASIMLLAITIGTIISPTNVSMQYDSMLLTPSD